MKTFRREYRVSIEEEDELIKAMTEPLRESVLENVGDNVEKAVDRLMNYEGVVSDMTFTITWKMDIQARHFIEALKKIRGK